MKEARS